MRPRGPHTTLNSSSVRGQRTSLLPAARPSRWRARRWVTAGRSTALRSRASACGLCSRCPCSLPPAWGQCAPTAASQVADALPLTLAQVARDSWPADGAVALPLFGEAGFPAVVHRAAGMVSEQCGCEITDALALLRARAFSTGRSAQEIAAGVLCGELRLR